MDLELKWDSKELKLNLTGKKLEAHGQHGQATILEEENGEKWLADLPLSDRVSTYDHVAGINLQARGKKLMPLGGPALADEDVEAIRLWMVAKTEENKEAVAQ